MPAMPAKPRIRFASEISQVVCSVPCVDELTDQEKRAIYWTTSEFKGIRMSAKLVTKDIRKLGSKGIAPIEEAFATALYLCTKEDSELDLLLANPEDHCKGAQVWCTGDSNGRGLERYISPTHRFKRAEYAKEARAAVLRMHRSDKISSDQLASFYVEYAKSATVYSRLMGHADYLAAHKSHHVTEIAATTTVSGDQSRREALAQRGDLLLQRQFSQRIETV